MPQSTLDPKTLTAFENAAAGHDGVLSDPTGSLVIKPCTAAEIDFYESANASHPGLAAFMPTYMGNLELNTSPEATIAAATAATGGDGTAATLSTNDVGPMKGKKLATDTCIVLENAAAGFTKPNILDLKLGARLYDDDTAQAKRDRLDKVANETTSASLGFRIAGMRVWQGEGAAEGQESKATDEYAQMDVESKYKTFNKLYGRVFDAENVAEGFREYFLVQSAGHTAASARRIVGRILRDVRAAQAALEAEESKMYSASLLFVYEGDAQKAKEAEDAATKAEVEALQTATAAGKNTLNEEDDDEVELDDDEEPAPKVATVKLIDFAHASWTPGQGPDENALRGVRSVVKILEDLEVEFSKG